ncbi:hypothetical protein N3K66_001822 [Trichothecium roseum]|uniref:Uncharacterized protein n=1 Tax=Trichothecium roseum TaxID=47278 RepID=A0ACC0V7V1_9HYPO|nr:hypothetical protein N3K66_001822 [Trichothecium roseum]
MTDSTQRIPRRHPDFKKVEASRPPFDTSSTFHMTQTPDPEWSFGQGTNNLVTPDPADQQNEPGKNEKKHVAIDPYEQGRPANHNYKLLISAIVPRPIAFLSTRSADGTSSNLAPFSYFNMMHHDPPILVIGFSTPASAAKDSMKNLLETGHGVVNVISESFVEAANATSVNAPYGSSEWHVSGLTPVHDCQTVPVARVKEAVFSVEVKLDSVREWDSKARPGEKSGAMVILEGTRFWAREDALNEDKNLIDPAILRPMSRLGGITYARTTQALELTRPDFEENIGGADGYEELKNHHDV